MDGRKFKRRYTDLAVNDLALRKDYGRAKSPTRCNTEDRFESEKVLRNMAPENALNKNTASSYDGDDEDSYTSAHSAPSPILPERATSSTSEQVNMPSSTEPTNLDQLIHRVRGIVGLGMSSSDSENSGRDLDGGGRETAMQYRGRVKRKRGERDLAAVNTDHEARSSGRPRPSSTPEPRDVPSTEECMSEPGPSSDMSVMSISSDDRYTAEIDKILPDADEVVEVCPDRATQKKKFRLRNPRSEQVMAENEAANEKLDELDGLLEPTLRKYGFSVDDKE